MNLAEIRCNQLLAGIKQLASAISAFAEGDQQMPSISTPNAPTRGCRTSPDLTNNKEVVRVLRCESMR